MAPFDDFSFLPVTGATPVMPVLLPHVPSALIRLALADLQKVERTPGYEIEMGTFHTPSHGLCLVCLAGATMAMSLKVSFFRNVEPEDMGKHNEKALEFLSYLAYFKDMKSACEHIDATPIIFAETIPNYGSGKHNFHAAMHALADAFAASGQ